MRSNTTKQKSGHFTITSGISKPRHVFVYIINDRNIDSQTRNPFLYNTFTPGDQTLSSCYLVVGNSNEYPDIHYTPSSDTTRVYRDVLKDVHKNSEYGEGTLLNMKKIFIYFFLCVF